METLTEENSQRKKFNIEDRKKIEFLECENKRLELEIDNLNDVNLFFIHGLQSISMWECKFAN